MQYLFSTLGLSVVAFYFYMAAAFYRRAKIDHPEWGHWRKTTYALTWPATAWMAADNPAKK